MAVLSPIVVGLIFGVEGVVGLLGGGVLSGLAMAVFTGNAGGAWIMPRNTLKKAITAAPPAQKRIMRQLREIRWAIR